MKECKDKLLASEQCIEQLEGHKKVIEPLLFLILFTSTFINFAESVVTLQKLESRVGEMVAARDQAQQEVQKLQKEGSEVKKKAKELQHLLDTEKAG